MRNLILVTLICTLFAVKLSAQTVKHDTLLIQKIDSMFKDDQFWRKENAKAGSKTPSKYDDDTIQRNWAKADSINEVKAKAIIKKYGYPGYSLVGEWSGDFWAIVQHCDDDIPFQEEILKLMKIEVDRNNAGKENYAYLTDRVLVNKKEKQIYGTQIHIDLKTHKASPFPVQDPGQLNALRKKMGLGTEEEYLKGFNR